MFVPLLQAMQTPFIGSTQRWHTRFPHRTQLDRYPALPQMSHKPAGSIINYWMTERKIDLSVFTVKAPAPRSVSPPSLQAVHMPFIGRKHLPHTLFSHRTHDVRTPLFPQTAQTPDSMSSYWNKQEKIQEKEKKKRPKVFLISAFA